MNLGEFIIKIGTQGDTKALDEAIKKMSEAEKKTRKQIKLMQDLAKATSDEEKALIDARYYQEMTQSEASKCLGISQVQVSRKEGKILEKLRCRL